MRACIFTLVVITCASASAQQITLPTEAGNLRIPLGAELGQPALVEAVLPQPGVAGADVSWRYRNHNGKWWYWLPSNRWVLWNGSGWVDYVEPTYSVEPTYGAQPHTTYYRYESASPYGGYGSGGYYNDYGRNGSSGYGRYYSPGYGASLYLGGQSGYGYGNRGYGYGANGRGGNGRGGRR